MKEKRKNKRFIVMCKADCMNTEVDVIDISKVGMKIDTKHPIKSQSNISFYVILPDLEIINITGDIIWELELKDNRYRYGLNIKPISDEHESTLNSLINDLKNNTTKKE